MIKTIGQTIKELRKERHLTQEELADQLNVTSQAVSKWENEVGMPDISQIVPLASVFGVSTDVLFGIEGTTADDEALEIIKKAYSMQEYGNIDTYLTAYDELIEGLKKYPNNLMLLNNCMGLGLALSLPENGWMYASNRAKKIAAETIRQANLIISFSSDMSDIMRAHQVLVLLYSSEEDFDKAISEAQKFPVRSDFTMYSHMAKVDELRKDYSHAIKYLCSDIDYLLQHLEDNIARLGQSYYKSGKFNDAITVYETFFAMLKMIFINECPPPYHDFDSGDCYILLAQAYLAIGETEKAMNSVENSIMYYLNMSETYKNNSLRKALIKSPLLKETELTAAYASEPAMKERLLEKLSSVEIEPLNENTRFKKLYDMVMQI